jgi:hypothetical protein
MQGHQPKLAALHQNLQFQYSLCCRPFLNSSCAAAWLASIVTMRSRALCVNTPGGRARGPSRLGPAVSLVVRFAEPLVNFREVVFQVVGFVLCWEFAGPDVLHHLPQGDASFLGGVCHADLSGAVCLGVVVELPVLDSVRQKLDEYGCLVRVLCFLDMFEVARDVVREFWCVRLSRSFEDDGAPRGGIHHARWFDSRFRRAFSLRIEMKSDASTNDSYSARSSSNGTTCLSARPNPSPA